MLNNRSNRKTEPNPAQPNPTQPNPTQQASNPTPSIPFAESLPSIPFSTFSNLPIPPPLFSRKMRTTKTTNRFSRRTTTRMTMKMTMVKAETTMTMTMTTTTRRRKTVTRMKTVKKSLALDIQLFVYTVETAHTREGPDLSPSDPQWRSSTIPGPDEAKHSILLERLRLRHLKHSSKPSQAKTQFPPKPVVAIEKDEDGFKSKKGKKMVGSFEEIGLSEEVMGAVREMGIEVPTEIQCIGIPAVLDGKSVVLGSHTGSGKTLAYMLPLVQVNLLSCLIDFLVLLL
ncbi:hypothetical protein MANES_13G081778v8 [Manihot esculenta]|uniref:Uncharacterized protein n=1 Tax=Manihot esculenta TaxID=3983 RepID=A0ACB7GKN0_MANES|nr:hypothetical protein MANES_13G081778v8 [Manihot esculenta]